MKKALLILGVFSLTLAQTLPKNDPVLKGIYEEAKNNSQLKNLAHELFDGYGPRLVGSPGLDKAADWAIDKMDSWGIDAEKEEYGTWIGWERGITHVDMVKPWVRSLEGMSLAWSPSTNGKTVEAETVTFPQFKDAEHYQEWLKEIKGKFVLISRPEISGRPRDNWEEFGLKADLEALKEERDSLRREWTRNLSRTGLSFIQQRRDLPKILEKAGAAGLISMRWSQGWGVSKVFSASTEKVPTVGLSLEDYGILYRLTASGNAPTLRVKVDSKMKDEVETFNIIGKIEGKEKPNEYVILSAHFDSWDGAQGATDNGTGTLVMLETIRVLKKMYPNPKRTILIGLWNSEEQGLNGSRAFVKDNPEIVKGIQAVFNQDNGTGRVERVLGNGFLNASDFGGKWLSLAPQEVTRHIKSYDFPGSPAGGGSDYAAFVAVGAPAYNLSSLSWSYWNYTWHTNRDTYDKVVFSEVMNNVILTASLAYLASEDERFHDRTKRDLPFSKRWNRQGKWPEPRDGARKFRRR